MFKMKKQQRQKNNISRGGGRGGGRGRGGGGGGRGRGGGGGSNGKRKTPAIDNDPFFNDKNPKRQRGKGEEILSSEEDDDDFVDRNGEEEDVALEDTETADDKRLKLAKAYLDKIREITKAQEEENEEDEDEEGRRGKRDSLVAEILQQEQLEESGRVQRLFASRVVKPSKQVEWRVVKRHKQSVTTVVLREDDSKGFSASKDGTIFHWDVETGASEKYDWPNREAFTKNSNKKQGSKHILSMAISSDGRYLATGGLDRYVHLWDTRTREHIQAFPGHRGAVSCLAFRQGTQQLISGSFDRTIKLWSAEDRSYMDTLYGHQSEILTVDCLRKERVLSVGRDHTLRLWKIPEETQLVFRGHAASLECCCFVNNEEFISGSDDGSIELWSMMRKKPVFIAKGAHGNTGIQHLSEDHGTGEKPEEMTSSQINDGNDIGNGNITHKMGSSSFVESWVGALAVCTGSDLAASGAGDGMVRLWAIENSSKSLKVVHDIPLTGFVNSLAFARSGRFLIAGVGQEPRLGRWGRIQAARNGVALYPIELSC
ncbi:hypothetical protein SUGI_0002220 [Cryptomeria japonica]|uniref:U3 snoRNP-associated protein-like EMB2271 n=1 Tax=Cryptomeria japonica TaxID=3369 RepID=UPI002408AED9|nr:U3 snoRNP-associated protein-like EMB2271 [Cryptomeria japonica]GLJ04732.1 hypothetical protein SUGI_0002220 [Cryptomeria japonica]